MELPGLLPGSLLGEGTGRRSGRDWVVDLIAFWAAVGVGLAVFVGSPDLHEKPRWFLALDLVGGIALCLALWWRRAYPTQIAWAAALLGAFSAMSAGAALVALFSVAVHRRAGVCLPIAGVGLALTVPYEFLRGGDELPWPVTLVIVALLLLVVVGWGMLVRARRQLVVSLRDRAGRAEAEQQLRVEQARQTERARIAREMHDVLAHRISLVSLHAGALEYRADASPDDVARSAAVIRQSAHEALQDLREILGVLRTYDSTDDASPDDQVARPVPTLADVPRLVEESRAAGMRVDLGGLPVDVPVPAGSGRTAYRVVQEGLTNARKHAAGARVTVTLSGGPGAGLSVDVRNARPVGPPPAPADAIPGAGQGLAGLAERVGVAGGRLAYGYDGPTWRLTAWVPWPGPGPGPGPVA
ncbi:sensor histidine kinase [Spongisporangium articulatum]|uniref:histidine kinase n=1 Tax=Spongisporangium articulatum TaxID=3362603 RepID=A0ABW8AKM5_9ACTN